MKFNKKQLLVCILLVSISFVVRWFRLNDFLFFGFEQGRDALVTQSILNLKHFPLIGPSTSFPGIFHGAYYYYLLAIPYYLGSGNPLFAAFFIVLISSLTSAIGYFFAKFFFGSVKWGIIYAVLIALNFEYILYARWLSNVSPAVPFALMAFYMLWKYSKLHVRKFLLLFFFFASIASTFEMILFPQFIFTLLLLYIFKIIRIFNFRDLVLGTIVSLMVFSPLIAFDFRNDHISYKSIIHFTAESNTVGNFSDSIKMFLVQTNAQFQRVLVYNENLLLKLTYFILLVSGIWFYIKKKEDYKNIFFLVSWSLMGLPLIIISPGNTQNYLGIGLAWVFLLVCAIKGFWDRKIYYAEGLLIMIVIFSCVLGIDDIYQNKNIIFRTIQDDLNYADQRKVLNYIHQDSKGQAYKLITFTIPYLQPEGWEYLHNFFYPQDLNKDAKVLYIIIEKHVAPEWGSKWIAELGKTELLSEVQFGLLRVQKRILELDK